MNSLKPLRVLVVDDHHDGAEALGLLLQLLGCEVRLTHSGEEAIEVAPAFHPHLVILDINMGQGIDGYETAIELRRQPWASTVPFFAHTAAVAISVEDARKAGFAHLIRKPAPSSAFEAIVAAMRLQTDNVR